MSIYTKTGDDGTSGMLSGIRVGKDSPYLQVLGALDEATSCMGLAKSQMQQEDANMIHSIQSRLIEVMGEISSQFQSGIDLSEDIIRLEKSIDVFQGLYPLQTGFITPGDSGVGSGLDMARSVTRRAERELIHLSSLVEVPDQVRRYINRLSDFLYAFARMIEFREKVKKAISAGTIEASSREMNLESALHIAAEVEAKASEMGIAVVVSLCNQDGAPILTHRMDEAFVVSYSLARKKAYTAAIMKMPTHKLAELTSETGEFNGLENMIDEEIVTLGGGFPIESSGRIIGGIGVSGSTVDNDTNLALFGSKSLIKQ